MFLVNRYHQQSSLLQRSLFHDRIMCDYLFEKDKIYAYQTLADEELMVYDKIYSIFSEKVAKPDLTIYLEISLPTLMLRISQEGTSWEKNIAEKYLEDIVEAFDYFFFNYQATPLLVVKADESGFQAARRCRRLDREDQAGEKESLVLCSPEKTSKETKK